MGKVFGFFLRMGRRAGMLWLRWTILRRLGRAVGLGSLLSMALFNRRAAR